MNKVKKLVTGEKNPDNFDITLVEQALGVKFIVNKIIIVAPL